MIKKRFIGIDIAWTSKNETGVCIIDENGRILLSDSNLYSNLEICNLLSDVSLADGKNIYVGIDAPLIFPDSRQEYRSVEKNLKKTKINGFHLSSFQVSKEYMERVYKEVRGEEISLFLVSDRKKYNYTDKLFTYPNEIIETFPTGIVAGLLPEIFPTKYKLKGKLRDSLREYKILYERIKIFEKEGLIEGLEKNFSLPDNKLKRKEYKRMEDKFDAFLCALGLYLVYKKHACELYIGDTKKGIIFLPIKNK